MGNIKKVSIIVPIYNQEKFLNTCIESILNQTYENIEAVLINDGSTDKSSEIIDKYSRVDNRIKYFYQKNGGLVDATLKGISVATGDYICFVDPDDKIGENFIFNFISEMDDEYDFIASGYFTEKKGSLIPKFLDENKIFTESDIKELAVNYLLDKKSGGVSHSIFISRWNKIYNSQCVKRIVSRFEQCREVSLGEDSIFTYLLLMNSKKGKSIQGTNSYFYNIGNQDSMMNQNSIESYLDRLESAYEIFKKIISNDGNVSSGLPETLYYFLYKSMISRSSDIREKKFISLIKKERQKDAFRNSLKVILKKMLGIKAKISVLANFGIIPSTLVSMIRKGKLVNFEVRFFLKQLNNLVGNIFRSGTSSSLASLKFDYQRKNAHIDLVKYIPLIEDRIQPMLDKYLEKTTELSKTPIKKNIFVFWWDGFDSAPNLVNKCFSSIVINYPEYNIFQITKANYSDFTNIHSELIEGFKNKKFSIQTFSDILRFNILKNNGGIWIDATIFFTKQFDMLDTLNDKSFESISFSASNSFLKYKNESCTWSGYFMSSRKNGLLVSVVDLIFREYFLQYGTYNIYFFMDAVLMICKLNKIDKDVLSKVQNVDGDMFLLARVLEKHFDPFCYEVCEMVPQKLNWKFSSNIKKGDFYNTVLNNNL